MTETTDIACGIAGWSYQDWRGIVYPPGTRDQLRYVARFVDMIEINSTFYRPPDAGTVDSWVRRTEDLQGFFFSAKIHQDITHRGVIDPAMVRAFRDGLAPLIANGKLRFLLAQFRWDFDGTNDHARHIRKIAAAFGDMAHLVVELRHNAWQNPKPLEFLGKLGVSVANLDYPLAHNSFNLPICTVGQHAYFRLHGRNAKAWFDRNAGRDETYNYLYSEKELDDIATRSAAVARKSESMTVVANNHFQGKQLVNALQLKAKFSGGKVSVPPGLAAKYPELAACGA